MMRGWRRVIQGKKAMVFGIVAASQSSHEYLSKSSRSLRAKILREISINRLPTVAAYRTGVVYQCSLIEDHTGQDLLLER